MAQDSGYGSAGMGFMDGAYLPVSEMRLPITDMGFQLGDMCYDAIHVHKGSFFRLKDHLNRWENSVRERRYTSLGYDREQVAEVLHGCVARGNLREFDGHLHCHARLALDGAQGPAELQQPVHGLGAALLQSRLR